jgi:ABC-type Fe3+/spermidine/putrescine transport system ATPase subunit
LTQVPRNLLGRKPNEVSGGQQQRIAIARALATRPAALLLDEPLSALDRKVRQEVREELKRVQRESGITTIFVTHDQEEALYLADRVLVMADGAIVQSGRGPHVYGKPQSEFVAGFVGSVNLLPAELEWLRDDTVTGVARIGGNALRVPGCVPSEPVIAGRAPRGLMAVRPEQLLLTPLLDESPISASQGAGEVAEIDFTGPTATVRVDVGDRVLTALVLSRDVLGGAIRVGQQVAVAITSGVIVLADPSVAGGHGVAR